MAKRLGSAYCNVLLIQRNGIALAFNAVAPGLVVELLRADRKVIDRYHLYGLDDIGRLVYHMAPDETCNL